MQTFLPWKDFMASARSLDRARLGKQRIEAWQILQLLTDANLPSGQHWRNHPAVLMWEGHELKLCDYGAVMCSEWSRRGYVDNMLTRFVDALHQLQSDGSDQSTPGWLGSFKFHQSHRSNLIRKDPEHYGPQFPNCPDDLPYYWPTKEESWRSGA